MCRSRDSNYGPVNYIDATCSGQEFVDEAGPSPLCTGAASRTLVPTRLTPLLVALSTAVGALATFTAVAIA